MDAHDLNSEQKAPPHRDHVDQTSDGWSSDGILYYRWTSRTYRYMQAEMFAYTGKFMRGLCAELLCLFDLKSDGSCVMRVEELIKRPP